jgi:hypothetical protein
MASGFKVKHQISRFLGKRIVLIVIIASASYHTVQWNRSQKRFKDRLNRLSRLNQLMIVEEE